MVRVQHGGSIFGYMIVTLVCWASLSEIAAAGVSVEGISVTMVEGRPRIVFDLSGRAEYRFFRLGEPERLVFDLSESTLNESAKTPASLPLPVTAVRHGMRPGGALRLVIDLEDGDYRARHFVLSPDGKTRNGYQLIVDVSAASGGALASNSLSGSTTLGAAEYSDSSESNNDAPLASVPSSELVVESLTLPSVQEASNRSSADGLRSDGEPQTVPAATRREAERQGLSVGFSGTWQHEWGWGVEVSRSQKFESILQPRWDVGFSNGADLTAILRVRADATGDLGPGDRRPPNYSDVSSPWYNAAEAEVSLREFYIDFQAWGADFRLGKQQVVWGQADGLKVLDVVNPQSFREFVLDDFDDSRIPLWTANVNVSIGDSGTLQLLWIPDTTYHELAEQDAIFALRSPRLVPELPISQVLEPSKPDNFLRDSDVGMALSGFVGGWDLSLNYLYRYLDAPVLPVSVTGDGQLLIAPEYRRSHLLGGSFSNVFGDVTLRGELAYSSDTFQPTNLVSEKAIAETEEFSAVVGLDWVLSMDSLVSVQWFSSYIFDHSDAMGRDELEQTLTLLYQQDFANTSWRFRGILIRSVNEGDSQLQLKLSHWISSSLEVWFGADVFSGDERGLFGQFDQNDRLLLGFEYGF